MVTNITTGVCQHRAQAGKPSFFVSWADSEGIHYVFNRLRFTIEDIRIRLEEAQKESENWQEITSKAILKIWQE